MTGQQNQSGGQRQGGQGGQQQTPQGGQQQQPPGMQHGSVPPQGGQAGGQQQHQPDEKTAKEIEKLKPEQRQQLEQIMRENPHMNHHDALAQLHGRS